MSTFRDGMIGPTLILTAICLVMTFALAGTYVMTKPVIEAQKKTAVNAVEFDGMPAAGDFVIAEIALPEGVEEAYKMPDSSYYVIKAVTKGYGGPVEYIVGLDADGNYVGILMAENTETPGLGSKAGVPDYLAQYYGSNDFSSVDAVSGATITSNALKAALELVNQTYDLAKGV